MAKSKTKETQAESKDPDTRDPETDERLYRGHGVVVQRQAVPGDPDYPTGADPTTVALVQDWRGMHHSVSIFELEPPLDPYPPPPPDEGATGASGATGMEFHTSTAPGSTGP
jgi:hypothetical protein